MTRIEAIIRPELLEKTALALDEAGISGYHTLEIQGHGRQRGQKEIFRGREYDLRFRSKVRLILVVQDADVERVSEIILTEALTGAVGDGKIFYSAVQQVYRIRTRESGAGAL